MSSLSSSSSSYCMSSYQLQYATTFTLLNSWKSRIEAEGGTADIKIDEFMRSFSGDVISRACFDSNYSKGEEIILKLRALQEAMSKKSLSTGVLAWGMSILLWNSYKITTNCINFVPNKWWYCQILPTIFKTTTWTYPSEKTVHGASLIIYWRKLTHFTAQILQISSNKEQQGSMGIRKGDPQFHTPGSEGETESFLWEGFTADCSWQY